MLELLLTGCLIVMSLLDSNEGMSTANTTHSSKVLVSGYNSDIALYSIQSNTLARAQSWQVDPNLTWMVQAAGSFWAIHEVDTFHGEKGGAVSRWQLENNTLVRQEVVSLTSGGPAHLLVDLDNNLAYTANYGGGTVTVVSIEDGKLDKVVQVLEYGPGCRDHPHPHHVVRKGDRVWVVDLGCDSIYHYTVQERRLVQTGVTHVEAGAGPRHMVLDGALAYVACEVKNYVLVFQVNTTSGELTQIQQLQLSDAPTNYGAEILVAGDFVYASSRGVGGVSVFRKLGNQLAKIQELALAGTWPRSIAIKDNIMLAADQKGDSLQIISIDIKSGLLSGGGNLPTPSQPAFIMFYN